jgi:hypothetical protein
VLELVYTAWDMEPFARDMGDRLRSAQATGPPFVWGPEGTPERRAHLRAQLDAFYFHRYGLHRKQVRYVLDPHSLTDRELEDILDPAEDPPDAPGTSDFPGETFRVLKEKEIKKYGEYRTGRLVLHYFDAWARGDMAEFERWLPGPRHPGRR